VRSGCGKGEAGLSAVIGTLDDALDAKSRLVRQVPLQETEPMVGEPVNSNYERKRDIATGGKGQEAGGNETEWRPLCPSLLQTKTGSVVVEGGRSIAPGLIKIQRGVRRRTHPRLSIPGT
jgi:hypothetical protein